MSLSFFFINFSYHVYHFVDYKEEKSDRTGIVIMKNLSNSVQVKASVKFVTFFHSRVQSILINGVLTIVQSGSKKE